MCVCVCIQVYAGIQRNKKRASLLMELGLQVVVSCWAYVLGTKPSPLEKQIFFNYFFKKQSFLIYIPIPVFTPSPPLTPPNFSPDKPPIHSSKRI